MNLSLPDLVIELSPSQRLHAQTWINTLLKKGSSIFAEPIFDGLNLRMSACDVAQLLELNEPAETSLFDLQRMKTSALKQLHKIKARKRDPLIIRHYENMIQMIAKEDVGAERTPAPQLNQNLEFIR